MIKAKKILGVTLAAAALAATMSMGAAAESSVVVNLMPTDVNSISCDRGGGTAAPSSSRQERKRATLLTPLPCRWI